MEEEIIVGNNTRKKIISKETLSQEWGEISRVEEFNSDSDDNSETSEKNEKVKTESKSPHTSPITRRLSMRAPSVHIFRPPEINELENAEFLEKLAKEISTFPTPPNINHHHTNQFYNQHHNHSNNTNHSNHLFQQSSNSSLSSTITPTSTSSILQSNMHDLSLSSSSSSSSIIDHPPEESPSARRKVAARWTMVAKLARKLTAVDSNQNNENSNKSKSKSRRGSKSIPNISEDQYV